MSKAKQEEPNVLERIRIKGKDFDIDGKETPREELYRMEGLFKLKDVEKRIPFDTARLKYWYSSDGPYRKCFTKIPMGEKRSLILVDMQMLSAEFQAQWRKGQK